MKRINYNEKSYVLALKKKFPNLDFKKTKFINMKQNVVATCPLHGDFKINAFYFLHNTNYGCNKCGREASGNKKTKPKEQFILEASKIHNKKYDYSKVNYKNSNTKVEIICPFHGSFFMLPSNHINKNNPQGCPECIRHTWTNEEFIEKAKKYHGLKYDYSKINYTGEWEKIEVICKKHGAWFPYAHNFASDSNHCGCPKCKESNGERSIRVWLENNKFDYEQEYRFKDCKDINSLPFDFYLKKENLVIEFQGEQHYKLSKLWKDNDNSFKKRKHHDWLKRKYAKKNNIRYLSIPFWELKNVNTILESFILNS
jgi:hypothetical protein